MEMSNTVGPNDRLCNRSPSYRLVIMGAAPVGKSALLMRFIQDQFDEHINATIGAYFESKTISIESRIIDLEGK